MALAAGGLVALRCAHTGHAPDVVDAVMAFFALLMSSTAWTSARARTAALVACLGAVASVPASVDLSISWLSLSLVLGAVGFFGLALVGPGRPEVKDGVAWGLVVGGTLHAVVALWQRFVLWPDALARREELQLTESIVGRMMSQRPIGLSLSPDLGAGITLAAGALAVGMALEKQRRPGVRAAATVALLPLVAAFVLSRSYGAVLAVGVALLVLAVARRSWRAGWGFLFLAVPGGWAVAARGLGGLVQSASERWWNWRVGLDAFLDAPVFGHGLFRFAAAYAARRPPEANVTRYAHSTPVQLAAETGVVGLLAACVVVAVLVPKVRAGLQSDSASRVAAAFASCALAVRACFDYDAQVGQTAMVAAAVVGLASRGEDPVPPHASSLATAGDDDETRSSSPGGGAFHQRRSRSLGLALAAVAAVLAIHLFWRGRAGADSVLCRWDADVALRAAVGTQDPAVRQALLHPFVNDTPAAAVLAAQAALERQDVVGAHELLRHALTADPSLPAAHLLLVSLARAGFGDVQAREAEARKWGVALPNENE